MTTSKAGLDIIKEFEGFRSKPYLDIGGVPTIGYGTTRHGNRDVQMDDIAMSKKVASNILENQVNSNYAKEVSHAIQVDVTQNQFDAMVSFAYNVGIYGFKKSTLLKKLNHGKKIKASKEFGKWIHVNGKVSKGLKIRRKKEAELFLA